MPTIPKWLGDTMENVFSGFMYPVKVTEVEYLDKKLKKVRFEGDLSKAKFVPGTVIEFRVNDTDFRHYTQSFFDSEKGICDVIFYLHNKGNGSQWAEGLKVGDETKILGPGGKIKYNKESKYHFFFGDETSLGLINCIKESVIENSQNYFCLLELDEENKQWKELLNLSGVVANKSIEHPAKDSIEIIEKLDDKFWDTLKEATFYLTGNAKSIQSIRKALKKERFLQEKFYQKLTGLKVKKVFNDLVLSSKLTPKGP